MFGIILNSNLSSMLGHQFHKDAVHEIYYCEYVYLLYTEKSKMFIEYIIVYLLKSVHNINIILKMHNRQ